MTQLKAHWANDGRDWFARVGPFQMEARIEDGRGIAVVVIFDDANGDDVDLFRGEYDGPVDLVELMARCELHVAACLGDVAGTLKWPDP